MLNAPGAKTYLSSLFKTKCDLLNKLLLHYMQYKHIYTVEIKIDSGMQTTYTYASCIQIKLCWDCNHDCVEALKITAEFNLEHARRIDGKREQQDEHYIFAGLDIRVYHYEITLLQLI